MAMNLQFDWRRYDRRLFAAVALLLPLIVVAGFARSYYFKLAFGTPPLRSLLLHLHGIVMTLWVAFFISQVWLIRSKSHRLHMRLGWAGVALAVVVIVVGFFTAVAGAKYGEAPLLPNLPPPIQFLVVPFFDILIFAGLFGAAVIYRKRLADHKRLMLLTAISLLPPALGRMPFEPFISGGPPVFFGIPTVIALGLLGLDTWKHRKLNVPFAVGAAVLIVSYPIRLMLMGTEAWNTFAIWLTSWAA